MTFQKLECLQRHICCYVSAIMSWFGDFSILTIWQNGIGALALELFLVLLAHDKEFPVIVAQIQN